MPRPWTAEEEVTATDLNAATVSPDEKDALSGSSGTPSNTNRFVTQTDLARVKFGGTGADGALSISSGTTTIDCANANIVVKNYTSISITGTGKLAFSNPATNGTIVILKSQGAVVLTSNQAPMIDMSGMGAAGGTKGTGQVYGGAAATDGSLGTLGFRIMNSTLGTIGLKGTGAGPAAAATGGAILSSLPLYNQNDIHDKKAFVACGSGGSGGGGGIANGAGYVGGNGGDGGRGGGGLIIECGGSINFTTALGISVAGGTGGNGSAATCPGGNYGATGGGGGGGGSAGMALIIYNSVTAVSGTINSVGGAGGNGGTSTTGYSYSGGGGGAGAGCYGGAGGNGGRGSQDDGYDAGGGGGGAGNGGSGSVGSTSNGASANGGAGGSSADILKVVNTEFA